MSPGPEGREKGFPGKLGAGRDAVTHYPALYPLRFTFACRGRQAELLERWGVEVTFPDWGRRRASQVLPGPSNPHHPHSQLPQREPGSRVTSDPWILEPGPWALLSPSPTWCSLETGLFPLSGGGGDVAHGRGWGRLETGVTVASFGSFLTRGPCRWTQAVSPVPLPTFSRRVRTA